MLFIGIDPGVSGGIAVIGDSGYVIATHKMPATGRDLIDLLAPYSDDTPGFEPVACIEKVNPGVFGHGKAGMKMGVVSAFTFGRNVERAHMALLAQRIPYDEVLPVKWQTTLGCRSKGDKNVTKARAQQLFPHVKVTHAIADALLIAEFCRRTQRGKATPIPAGGLFDGKENEAGEEGKVGEGVWDEDHEEVEAPGERAAQAAPGHTADAGAAEGRAHRERRPRLRRSARRAHALR